MRIAFLAVAAAVIVGFLLARSKGPAVISGAPGAPAVISVPEIAPKSSESPTVGARSDNLATPILKTPTTVIRAPTRKPAQAQPLASSKE